MPQEKIYKNWKAVTEADFVSLFIKTWFAYISTLRTMFPEAANRRGDGKYLNAYKDYYRTSGSKKLMYIVLAEIGGAVLALRQTEVLSPLDT